LQPPAAAMHLRASASPTRGRARLDLLLLWSKTRSDLVARVRFGTTRRRPQLSSLIRNVSLRSI
jgi:hypothetical protein